MKKIGAASLLALSMVVLVPALVMAATQNGTGSGSKNKNLSGLVFWQGNTLFGSSGRVGLFVPGTVTVSNNSVQFMPSGNQGTLFVVPGMSGAGFSGSSLGSGTGFVGDPFGTLSVGNSFGNLFSDMSFFTPGSLGLNI